MPNAAAERRSGCSHDPVEDYWIEVHGLATQINPTHGRTGGRHHPVCGVHRGTARGHQRSQSDTSAHSTHYQSAGAAIARTGITRSDVGHLLTVVTFASCRIRANHEVDVLAVWGNADGKWSTGTTTCPALIIIVAYKAT